MKLVGSTENDLISHSPFEDPQNHSTAWEKNLVDKLNREESIFLRTSTNDDDFQRMAGKEVQTSEVQPDKLREKTGQDSLLSQGSKTKKVSITNQIFVIWK